ERSTVMRLYMSAGQRVAGETQHFFPDEITAQLRRVSGVNISYQITDQLGLKPWQSQFLAILAEAYPRVISVDTLCELYDSAKHILEQDRGNGVDNDMVRQFVYGLRKHCRKHALPDPIKRIEPEGLRITHQLARWLCYNIGTPAIVAEARDD
ncbi:MAG: hypothetical protein AAFP02_17660, partial [Bacteroidota bacterium]